MRTSGVAATKGAMRAAAARIPSSDTVSALGSYNSTTKTLTGLVGRGVGCSQNTEWCTSAFTDYTDAAPT